MLGEEERLHPEGLRPGIPVMCRRTARRHRGAGLTAAVVNIVCLLAACRGSCGSDRPDPERVHTPPPTPTVTFLTATAEVTVHVEVVKEPQELARGLMYRRKLAPYHGMLFAFPRQRKQVFWMKNTYIRLDMIFVNDERVVVGVVADAEPMTLTPRSVSQPARYVVEVAGGFAAEHGIVPGTSVALPHALTPSSKP
jgi:uncharacterized membrane protein (UPF0127 family)